MKPSLTRPLRVAGIYLVFSIVWILSSDSLLQGLVQDAELLARLQTFKGLFFVLLSALLILFLPFAQAGEVQFAMRAIGEQGAPLLRLRSGDLEASVGGGYRTERGPDERGRGAGRGDHGSGIGARRHAAGDDSRGAALRREECRDEAEQRATRGEAKQ